MLGFIEAAVEALFLFQNDPWGASSRGVLGSLPLLRSLPGQRRGACRANRGVPWVRQAEIACVRCGCQRGVQERERFARLRLRSRRRLHQRCPPTGRRRDVARAAFQLPAALLHPAPAASMMPCSLSVYPRPRDQQWADALASDERSGPPTSGLHQRLFTSRPCFCHPNSCRTRASPTPRRRPSGSDSVAAPRQMRQWAPPSAAGARHSIWHLVRGSRALPTREGGLARAAPPAAADQRRHAAAAFASRTRCTAIAFARLACLQPSSCVTTASPMHDGERAMAGNSRLRPSLWDALHGPTARIVI